MERMKHKVRFKPDEVEVSMERGKTLLEAAIQAQVGISTSCGGKGTCKKCGVLVEGPVEVSAEKRLDPELAAKGFVLACQSYASGDITVFVPEEARAKGHQILREHRAHRLSSLSPLTIMRKVSLNPPTLVDNLGDLERLGRALGGAPIQIPLGALRELPNALRAGDWKVSVTSWAEDIGGGIASVTSAEGPCHIGAALDIGTTTVVLSLVDLRSGETLSTASEYNRQSQAGDDVISRIAYAEEGGLEELQGLIIQTIDRLLLEARASSLAPLGKCDISAMSVAGNTTMVHLFLGLDPRHIRYEPYIPVTNLPPVIRAKELELGMEPEGPVYCLPGRASFVGGDITADVLSSRLHEGKELALLIDVGTNGEVVVGNDEFIMACSTSAGPAFEGGEVAAGMRAMNGAIEKVSIDEDLNPSLAVIGARSPLGICGSGLIDLVAQLFLRGLIDKKARIQRADPSRTRVGDEGGEYVLVPRNDEGQRQISVTDADLANILRTKAAVHAGCSVLLRTLEKGFQDLGKVYIAGGFGNYIDVENAILIGLLPDLPRGTFEFIGNAALAGAVECLLSQERRAEARRIHEDMTYVELSTSQAFFDEFSSASFLPHTDAERFPSVLRRLAR